MNVVWKKYGLHAVSMKLIYRYASIRRNSRYMYRNINDERFDDISSEDIVEVIESPQEDLTIEEMVTYFQDNNGENGEKKVMTQK